jgi:hypothetical protein
MEGDTVALSPALARGAFEMAKRRLIVNCKRRNGGGVGISVD